MNHSSYLRLVFDNGLYRGAIANVIKQVRKEKDIEAIAMRGISGYAVGFPVAFKCNLRTIVVRKTISGRYTHADCPVETCGWNSRPHNYVIVDDFVSSGKTVRHMCRQIKKELGDNFNCTKIILYSRTPNINGNYELSKGIYVPMVGVYK